MTKALVYLALACASAASPAQTGPAWAWSAGKITNNGNVAVKSASGASTYNVLQNPTGAVARTNQSAVTQPPTVIVQATASLPIKTLGSSCVSSTSGISPNQSATEGTAILADRSALLTCQGGQWRKMAVETAKPSNYGGQYLLGNYCVMVNENTGSCSCPAGYTAVETGRFAAGWYYSSFVCRIS